MPVVIKTWTEASAKKAIKLRTETLMKKACELAQIRADTRIRPDVRIKVQVHDGTRWAQYNTLDWKSPDSYEVTFLTDRNFLTQAQMNEEGLSDQPPSPGVTESRAPHGYEHEHKQLGGQQYHSHAAISVSASHSESNQNNFQSSSVEGADTDVALATLCAWDNEASIPKSSNPPSFKDVGTDSALAQLCSWNVVTSPESLSPLSSISLPSTPPSLCSSSTPPAIHTPSISLRNKQEPNGKSSPRSRATMSQARSTVRYSQNKVVKNGPYRTSVKLEPGFDTDWLARREQQWKSLPHYIGIGQDA